MNTSYLIFAGLGITGIAALFLGGKSNSSSSSFLSSYSPSSLSSYTPSSSSSYSPSSSSSYSPSSAYDNQSSSYMENPSQAPYNPEEPRYGGNSRKKASKSSTKRKKH